MGVCSCSSSDRKKKYEEHIKLRNALFEINNCKYSCPNCYRIPEIKEIDYDNQSIDIFCPEHGRNKIDCKNYLLEMHNLVQKSCENCGNQKYIVHDIQNGKYYCKKCFNKKYNKDESPNNENCKDHRQEDLVFCKTCDRNICSKYKQHENYHKNHQIFEKNDYEPKVEELNLILLFKKIITIVYESYFKDQNNFYHCINIKNFANFLKGSTLLNIFNKYFNCNIKSNDKKINLKDKEIGDSGFKLFCKLKFEELEQLILTNNNISNIEALKDFHCPKLKKLIFDHNNIRNINILQDIKFSLEDLDFSSNRIDNIKVLEGLNNKSLNKLKKLKIFCNNFKLDQNNKNIQKQIKEKLKENFKEEVNENYSKTLGQIDFFNASYNTTININDKTIDLSLIKNNNNDNHQILEELKHPNATSIKLGKSENYNIDFKNINKNCPNCNSLIFEDKKLYLKNQCPTDIKFKKNLTDLKLKSQLVDKKHSYQELFPCTFTYFTSIVSKQQYLIYYENIGDNADIYLVNIFNGKKKKETKETLNNNMYQIRYYIDVQEQKDILLGSAKESFIYYWELTQEKLNLINKFDGGVSFCMISDKIFGNNYIISSNNKETIYIWKNKEKFEKNIYLNDSLKDNNNKIYFIDYCIYLNKNSVVQSNIENESLQSNNENRNLQSDNESNYYIIIGGENGFISFNFISTKDKVDIKKFKSYENHGENKYAIVYSDNSSTYLIGSNFKNSEIKIFDFDSGISYRKIDSGENYLPLGINLWNNQYLIVCCRVKENESNDNKNEIKTIKIFDLEEEKLFFEIPNKSGALFSFKFIDNNSEECILVESLDGTIKLFSY